MYLNDKKIDSSRDLNSPYVSMVGDDTACKGFHEGVQKMSKGERAKLTIFPEMAFGPNGYPLLSIPASSMITFDIELLEIKLCSFYIAD